MKTVSSRIRKIQDGYSCVKRDHTAKKRIRRGKYGLTLRFRDWCPGGALALAVTPQAAVAQVHETSPEWLGCQERGSGWKAKPLGSTGGLDSAFT